MGISFFITPLEDIDPNYQPTGEKFRLEPDKFAEALRARWNDTKIGSGYSKDFDMSWECKVNHQYKLNGALFHDSCGIVLERPGDKDVEEFAIWFRKLVPAHVKLVIYNSSDITPFELAVDTTYLETVHFFAHHDYWITLTLANNNLIDVTNLQVQLHTQWPSVEIPPITEADPYAFYWEIKHEHEFSYTANLSERESVVKKFSQDVIVTGAVNKNRSELYVTSFPYPLMAETLIWYRSIVDKSMEILAERKEDHRQLKLRTETTKKEIIDTFRREWERE